MSFHVGDEVESLTGHPVGGVCPFGLNEGIKVYLDESLERFDHVFLPVVVLIVLLS
ncbi:YbaK/EbsC family protein [uncultured Catenibacterium sp.]|uniref:YbaK/EbsC family protein n=1 Tax=uncultured Catenibacterium sp. TaxID=286142 RepID=UPI0034511162